MGTAVGIHSAQCHFGTVGISRQHAFGDHADARGQKIPQARRGQDFRSGGEILLGGRVHAVERARAAGSDFADSEQGGAVSLQCAHP